MEAIPVKEMKKWAKDTLPPMAWQRVTFRILPQLNKLNVFLHFFEDDNYLLKDDVFKTLDNTFLEIFGKKFTDAPAEIIAPAATEKLAFVPTVVPVDEQKVVPIIPTADDYIQESLKSFEKLAERVDKIISIEKNEEEISPKLEEKQPVKVDAPIVEKVEEILPVDAPVIDKVEEILPIDEPVIEKVEEILPIDEPKVEKIEEIVVPPAAENLVFVPTVVPVDEQKVASIDTPLTDEAQESIKSLEKIAERLQEVFSLEKKEEISSQKLEEIEPQKVDAPIVEKVEEIVVSPATENLVFVPTVVPIEEPKVMPEVVQEHNVVQEIPEIEPQKVDAPVVEKVEEIVVPPATENLAFVPTVVPIEEPKVMLEVVQEPDVVQEIPEIKPLEKVEEIELPKEEKTEPEKPKEKPFVSFFSFEQLKRIFGKK